MSERGYDAPMDLAAFLTARLDEDEQVARAATPGPWSVRPETRSAHSSLYGEADVDGPDGRAVANDRDGGCASTADAEHIARHDPARVLAEVEAKRAILDEHGRRASEFWPDGTTCSRCVKLMSGWQEDWSAQEYPCRTLRFLALPYSDHPDYREEWKP